MKSGKVQPSGYRNGVSFDKAMNQAFSEIFQNLQEIEEGTKKQAEEIYHQRRNRKVSAPAAWVTLRGTEETKTIFKQPKQEIERKYSEITTSALSSTSSLQSLVDVEQVDIGLSFVDKVIEEDSKKQREDVDLQPRRRRVSAPVKTLTTTTTFKQPKKELRERKFSDITTPSLSTMPSWLSLEEEEVNIDQVDIGLGCNDEVIEEDFHQKQREDVDRLPRRRRVSAPARTLTETTETTTTFKQLRKDFVRKLSRPTLLPDLTLSTMPWLECFEEELEENFEPVEFNLSFLDDLIKA